MLAVCLAHPVLTGSQAVGEMFIGARAPFVAEHQGEVAHRARGIRFEQLARRRQREALPCSSLNTPMLASIRMTR